MNRLDRLTAILIQLQSKRIVKAQEIAERFEISLRTVYRDIRTLELAGVPIMSEAGIGYSLMKEYRLPPVQFTTDEAVAFFTADKILAKIGNTQTRKNFESGLYKIKSVLGHQEKELLDDANQYISVVENQYVPNTSDVKIGEILQAIIDKNILKIRYFSAQQYEENSRNIEPIGLYNQSQYWYLIAWCQMRKDYRNFRLDRIREMEKLSKRFDQKHPTFTSFLKQTAKEHLLTKITVRIDKNAYHYLGNQHFYMGFVSEKQVGNQIEMTFLSSNLNGFSHWFMLIGGESDILEPAKLKEMVLEKIENVKTRLHGKAHHQ
ncbi:MAG: transcriptional regulator [Cytophagaceae bacterium BCCC1]|nr:MAG: transcriptional regulator [Cytophagaceae bacterium BCCC1]